MNYLEDMVRGLKRDVFELRRRVKVAEKRADVMSVVALIGWVLMVVALSTRPAQAGEGRNWCADWADGYQVGFCWSRSECDYIPPAMCPYPLDGETDGYMRGLKDGLKDGEKK